MVEYAVFEEIEATTEDVKSCSYSVWSDIFKENVVESVVIKNLPESFIAYLEAEGIVLGEERGEGDIEVNSENGYSDWESDTAEEGGRASEENVQKIRPQDMFPELHEKIQKHIEELGGSVTPKLNWSAPKDSAWIMMNNNMKCTSANDVYLLMKSSAHIVHDLDHAFDDCRDKDSQKPEYELVLRKWIDINPALEFRVFVKDRAIIGACQRDLNHYTFLDELKPVLHHRICTFFSSTVENSPFQPASFIMDLYIPRPFDKVYVVDINPFTRNTDPLLFTWNELLTDSVHTFDLRLLSQHNVARFAKKEHTENQVPLDVIAASADPTSMVELAMQWQSLQDRADA